MAEELVEQKFIGSLDVHGLQKLLYREIRSTKIAHCGRSEEMFTSSLSLVRSKYRPSYSKLFVEQVKGWASYKLYEQRVLKKYDTCQICCAVPDIVHHHDFGTLGLELPGDVVACCRVCHILIHGPDGYAIRDYTTEVVEALASGIDIYTSVSFDEVKNDIIVAKGELIEGMPPLRARQVVRMLRDHRKVGEIQKELDVSSSIIHAIRETYVPELEKSNKRWTLEAKLKLRLLRDEHPGLTQTTLAGHIASEFGKSPRAISTALSRLRMAWAEELAIYDSGAAEDIETVFVGSPQLVDIEGDSPPDPDGDVGPDNLFSTKHHSLDVRLEKLEATIAKLEEQLTTRGYH